MVEFQWVERRQSVKFTEWLPLSDALLNGIPNIGMLGLMSYDVKGGFYGGICQVSLSFSFRFLTLFVLEK